MFKKLSVLLALLVIVGVTTVPANAITFNSVPDFDHPFVGLVMFYNPDGSTSTRCSGTLLAPTVLLTAGHCVYWEEGPDKLHLDTRVYFQQDAAAHYDPVALTDPFTGYPRECKAGTEGVACATSHTLYNYGFGGDYKGNLALNPNSMDIGLMILDQPVTLPEYGQLASAGYLDKLATKRGLQDVNFTASGYGASYTNGSPSKFTWLRSRLMAKSQLQNLRNALTDGYNVQITNNPGAGGGTCSGDSGGPLFYGGYSSNLVVGVTSYCHSKNTCAGVDLFYRTDQQDVIDWILAHAPDPSAIQIVRE